MGKKLGCRHNPPRDWKETTVHWLQESQYYSIPWIRKFVKRLEVADNDAKILALKKELERFLKVLETGGELERDEVQDINRALLGASLSVAESGLAIPEREPRPARHEEPEELGRRPAQGRDRGLREPTEQEIRDALRTPDNFGYSGDLPIGETWSIGPVIRTRDSKLLEESNATALEEALANIREFKNEYAIVHSGHWAVGWVDHLAFHAIDENREPTQIFKWILGWFDALENYPVADESDFSERIHDAVIKNIEDAASRIQDGRPQGDSEWEGKVYEWLEEHGSHEARRAFEDPENYSFDPDEIEEALRALNIFQADTKFQIRLVTNVDDPLIVTVYTDDRKAAIDDESIAGSDWEAPVDMNEAYAIIDNASDLPQQLHHEGYIVDDSEWFFPGVGLPGQRELMFDAPGRRQRSREVSSFLHEVADAIHTMEPEHERVFLTDILAPIEDDDEGSTVFVVNVKGTKEEAFDKAWSLGLQVLLNEPMNSTETSVSFRVKGTLQTVSAWYNETNQVSPPFPPGTLLLYRMVEEEN